MAEALLGVAFEKLLNLVESEFATLSGIKRKTEKLSSTLELIKAVLDDAEEKQWTNRPLKLWLQRLKDAVYVLDDVLEDISDECPTESLQLGCLSSLNPKNVMFRRGAGRKLNEMIQRLDQIAEDKNKFVLREGPRERQSEVDEWRQTSSTPSNPQVYGREEDKEKVVKFLLSPARGCELLSIYPIVGLGGLGKTTLSQLVYNDQRVSNHFHLRIWVCVSENFIVHRILCSIIESITKAKCDKLDLDVMEQKVQGLLQSKRYLLVLDDVWKRSQKLEFGLCQDKWDKLKSVLSCGSKGASILVSTRDMDVATVMGTCEAHDLSGLSEDDCWSLFQQRAFGSGKEGPAELVAIGKEIVKKCGGSPLAAQALGGLMRSRSTEKEWLEVKESKFWALDETDILPALRLSYFHLTPTLKQCFAFCAIFPKDKRINKQELIHLWMANGFISSRVNLDAEEVGKMIWNELYHKSFFQDVETHDYDLSSVYFKMHDLVHDLAQSITEQECMCFEERNLTNLSRNTHHIGFYGGEIQINKEAFNKVESLRTLYRLDMWKSSISNWFPISRSLRVLRTNSFNLSLLGNFTHLRYLELRDSRIKTLPESICDLRRLEILKLVGLTNLRCLPKHLARLENLRHLDISVCRSLTRMFPNIHKLSHLRTLSAYIVKAETGHSLAELRDLNLGETLFIRGLGNVGSLSEAQEANLKGKKDLWKLSLSWNRRDETNPRAATSAEEVLEALQPPSNLKVLTIYYYEGLHWPSWIGNDSVLSNLVSLTFQSCNNCQQLPLNGKLPFLRKLEIRWMKCVQYMEDGECYDGEEVRAFPSLEELRLCRLPNLERLLRMERGDMFPCLSYLDVSSCPKLQLPCLPQVKRLEVGRCNNESLRSISSFSGLHFLSLHHSEDVTSFPQGMMNNMTCLKTLRISYCPKLKELPYEITKLNALESLCLEYCPELESLPERDFEGLCSLRILVIERCKGLRSLPDGIQHLTSLEVLCIYECPALEERCKERTGEDWHKIAHIPKVTFFYIHLS